MKITSAIAGAALGLASTLATAEEWVDVKNPAELRALYSDKAHHRKTYAGETTVTYYRADGKALLVIGERRISRTWEIKGNDQVCQQDDAIGRRCMRVQRSKQDPKQILLQEVGTSFGIGGFARIEDGIPKF